MRFKEIEIQLDYSKASAKRIYSLRLIEIIMEYQEKLTDIYSPKMAKDFTELLSVSNNVLNITPLLSLGAD